MTLPGLQAASNTGRPMLRRFGNLQLIRDTCLLAIANWAAEDCRDSADCKDSVDYTGLLPAAIRAHQERLGEGKRPVDSGSDSQDIRRRIRPGAAAVAG